MKSLLDKLKGHPTLKAETAYPILFTIGFCHLLNDMIQSVIPAMYPIFRESFGFTFAQIGLITLIFQITSSIFCRCWASLRYFCPTFAPGAPSTRRS